MRRIFHGRQGLHPGTVVLGGVLLSACLCHPLAAQETAIVLDTDAAIQADEPETPLKSFQDITSEASARELIRSSLKSGKRGARHFLANKQLQDLAQTQLGQTVITRNPSIAIEQENVQQSLANVTRSDAVFDFIFGAALRHSRFDTYQRTDDVPRVREENVDFDQLQLDFFLGGIGQPQTNSDFVCVIVDDELVNGGAGDPAAGKNSCQDQTDFSIVTEVASFPGRTQFTWIGALSLTKPFWWGGSLRLALESERRKKDFYALPGFGEQALDRDDPLGLGYRFPWKSNLRFNFSSPAPLSKNFGKHGNFSQVALDLSRIQASQSNAVSRATVNQVQGQLQQRYWQLVGAVKQVQITQTQREILEDMAAAAQRQFAQQTITAYDLVQAEADLATIKNVEELAWNDYVVASNAVIELLDYEPNTLIFPAGYAALFDRDYPQHDGAARNTALKLREELKASQANLDSSAVLLKFRNQQLRPDVTLNASVALTQDDNAFGYEHWQNSMGQIFNPDQSQYFVGLTYRYPFGQMAEKSARSQARLSNQSALERLSQTELAITQEVDNAMAAVNSARSQRALARKNMELAELAYQKANRLKNLGLATQFELLRTLNDMLTARQSYIGASVTYHRAQVALQTSQGLLQ